LSLIIGVLTSATGAWFIRLLSTECRATEKFIITANSKTLPFPTIVFISNNSLWIGVLSALCLVGTLSTIRSPTKAATVWMLVGYVVLLLVGLTAIAAMTVFIPALGYKF